MTTPAPAPDYPEYAGLLAQAEASVAADGRFVDPVKMRAYQDLRRDRFWRAAILGHRRAVTLVEMHMLLIADAEGIEPPGSQPPPPAPESPEVQRYRERAVRKQEEWDTLRAKLPVTVELAYNYSGGNHYDTYTQGATHIITTQNLAIGRLNRTAGDALCTTPSRRKHQAFYGSADSHIPTCKNCLVTAARLAQVNTPALLTHGPRRQDLPF